MFPPKRALTWKFTPFSSFAPLRASNRSEWSKHGRVRHAAAAAAIFSGLAAAGIGAPIKLRRNSRLKRVAAGASRTGFGHPSRRMTDLLILANVAAFGTQLLTKQGLTVWGAKVNQLIVAGQYWRLITPAFLHGNLVHLAINCASLNALGGTLEGLSGRERLASVYMVAAVTGNLASFWGSPSVSLGASGAIFGLGGALAIFFYQNRNLYGQRSDFVLRQLGQTLALNVVYGFVSPRIDNWGHLGGLVGGVLAGYLLGPRLSLAETVDGRKAIVDEPPLRLFARDPVILPLPGGGRGRRG
ncbi:hypothetical protein ACKKBG_A09650 [Auxenochlorella protothecoides x Auxenochlorella symbiontica]